MEMLQRIEKAGRTCYKSEDLITDESAKKFVRMIIRRGHHSVLEHESVSVRIICDRGVTHEIVRHRLASYSQESTRYCNYGQEKHGGGIKVIAPPGLGNSLGIWREAVAVAERAYLELLENHPPEIARSVLPNSLKTEIVMTCNLREWRHFFSLRTASAAHPQMRQIARPMLEAFRILIPIIFDDVGAIDDGEAMRRSVFDRIANKIKRKGLDLDQGSFDRFWDEISDLRVSVE
jgi:thymidylate synthase (FAD)